MLLKQSTARTLLIFMTSTSDHIAGKTGLSAGLTIYLTKDGGAAGSISPTVAEIDSANMPGWYSLSLTTTHTNTLGDFALHVTGSGADPTDLVRQVVADLPGASVSSVTGAVGSVTGAVASVTGNVGGNVVGSVASVTARVTANTDQLAGQTVTAGAGVTFPGSVASPTNITAGTITTVTNLTNAPTAGDLTATMKTSVTTAATAATPTAAAVTGNVGGNVTGSVGSVASGGIAAASFAAGAINAAAIADSAIDRATFAADTGLQALRSSTAQAGAAGSITLDGSASAVTDFYVGAWIQLTGGTGVGQARVITAYNGGTKVATIAPNWATNPDVTSTFAITSAAQITGVQGSVTGSVGSVTGAVASVTGNVGGNVTGSVGSVVGAVGSVTGNVGGNVVGSVASVTARVTANTDQLAGQTVTAAAGVTFPTSVASPTNITAGTITTVTNLTNAPTAGDLTATMKTSVTTAATAATPTAAAVTGNVGGNVVGSVGSVVGAVGSVTGAVGSVTGSVGSVVGAVGSVTGNVGGNVTGSVGSIASGGIAAASFTAGAIDAAAIATDAFGALELAAGAASEIATAVRTELTTELARVDVAVSTRLATSGYTAPLDAAGTRSAVGLASANLDTQLGAIHDFVDTEVGAIKAVTDKVDTALELDGVVYRFTTNALEQAPTGGSAPTAADNAAAVWAAVTRTLTAGTNIALAKGVGVTGFNDLSAAQVNAEADTALADVGVTTTVTGRIDAAISSRLATGGYTAPLDAAGTRTAVGLASANLDTQLGTIAGYIDTEVAAIKLKTDLIPASPAAVSDIPSAASVASAVRTNLTTELARVDVAISTRLASAGYTAPDNAGVAAIFARTDVATSTRLATSGYTAPDNTSIAAILDDTGTSGVAVADKNGYRLSSAGVDDLLRTVLTEGYAAEGAAFTLEQALFMLWSLLAERGILSTTLTAGKLDHTPAMTFTLDSGTTPTAQERAT